MRRRKTANSMFATSIGYIALLFWSMAGVLAATVKSIPTFEILSVAFFISFSLTAMKLTLNNEWYKLKQPLILWVIGIIGVYGNDILFIGAFKYAPAAQVDLINYLWPIFVIVFAGMLPKESFSLRHAIAGMLGFIGTYLLVTNGAGLADFHMEYAPGYLLALLDAIVWSVYCLVARRFYHVPSEMIGMYCGLGMVCSIFIHFQFEATVIPTMPQAAVMIIMGLTTQGLAYFFWDYGIKQGDFKLLSILSYGNPIISILLLVAFGLAEPSSTLAIAALLVTLGGIAGSLRHRSSPRVTFNIRNICYNEIDEAAQGILWLSTVKSMD